MVTIVVSSFEYIGLGSHTGPPAANVVGLAAAVVTRKEVGEKEEKEGLGASAGRV